MPRSPLVGITALAALATIIVGTYHWDLLPYPEKTMHGSAPQEQIDNLKDDEILGSPYVRYESSTLDYRMRFPSTWTLDDRHEKGPMDVLIGPHDSVIMTLSTTEDPDLCAPWTIDTMLMNLEKAASLDPTYTNASFAKVSWKSHITIMSSGIREITGSSWLSRSFVIARPEYGGTLNLQLNIRSDVETLFADDVQAILDSLEVSL